MYWNGMVAKLASTLAYVFVLGGVAWVETARAQNPNDITLTLDSTTAQAGDTVELTVSMTINEVGPESIILFLAYDPASLTPNRNEYELILRNSISGEPILDDDGNTMAVRRAVRPSEAVDGADKVVDSEVFLAEGVIGVSVTGLNMTPIPEGALFTVAFTASGALGNGTVTDVIGLNADNAIVVPDGDGGVVPASTSASRSNEEGTAALSVSYEFVDSEVFIGCEPPGTPGSVTATQNRSDGVLVGWQAVSTTGAEYRVYRNTTNNPAGALALGPAWQRGTTFLDITAQVPSVVVGEGCTTPDQINEVRYFYWVRARTASGCQGNLSGTSAEGFRTQAKIAQRAGLFPMGGVSDAALVYGGVLLLLLGCRRAWAGRVLISR